MKQRFDSSISVYSIIEMPLERKAFSIVIYVCEKRENVCINESIPLSIP